MVTLKEIAERAGVSSTTVSNVLHGRTNKVSPEMVEKIQRLLDENNYIPRFGLNALTNRGSRMIGVVINTPVFVKQSPYEKPFYGNVIGTLENFFREKGYYIMIFSSKDIQEIMTMALGWNVDGIISISMPGKYHQKICDMTGKPVVSIDMNLGTKHSDDKFYNVTSKDYEGGQRMMEYLLEQGIKEVIYLANVKEGADYIRYEGANKVYKKHFGKNVNLEMRMLGRTYEERVEEYAMLKDLAYGNRALFFSTDLNAVECIGCLSRQNIRVPEDISIVGFDNDIYASLSIPRLTTMSINSTKKAELAADMLIRLIEGKPVDRKKIEIDIEFVKRDSVLER